MKLRPDHPMTAIAPLAHAETGEAYRCIDGPLTALDLAKAAGCTPKAVKRALNAAGRQRTDVRPANGGAVLDINGCDLPQVGEATRAAVALIVAERMELGRFGLKKRIEERAKARPAKPKERTRVTSNHNQHPWKVERHGRSFKGNAGGGVMATLACSRCSATLSISFRNLCNADDMDRKFIAQGWAVDPARCPAHNRRNHQPRKETKTVSTDAPTFATPTPGAIAAQAKMFGLLQLHFDTESGTYGGGYSDRKVADECHLSVDLVTGVREQAFGKLRVPSEVAALKADIEALEGLLTDAVDPIRAELDKLKRRVTDCCKKFGG